MAIQAEQNSWRPLAGRSVLVVEDELLVANDIADALARDGIRVVGPASTVDEALSLIAGDRRIDGAVIDLDLHGEWAFPVADALHRLGTPFVFATGHERSAIPVRYAEVRRLAKPTAPASLLQALFRRPEPPPSPTETENTLLARLDPADRERLRPHLSLRRLGAMELLEEAGREPAIVHFIIAGFAALTAAAYGEDARLALGLIGREGMTGTSLLLGGGGWSFDIAAQVPGWSLALPAAVLRQAVEASPSLRGALLENARRLMAQLAGTAIASARGKLEERLARALLMVQDRLATDDLPVTHRLLSIMMGVRRAGVTVATQTLEGDGLIRARRGRITIRNRPGLMLRAGRFYGAGEALPGLCDSG